MSIRAALGVMDEEVAWVVKWGLGVRAGGQDRLAQVHQIHPQTPEPLSPHESPCKVASLPVVMISSLKTGLVSGTSVSASPQHRAWGRAKLNK